MNFKTFYRTNRLRVWVIAFSSLMQPFVLIAAAYLNMLEINTLRDHNKKAWLIIVLASLLGYLLSNFFDMVSNYLLATHIREFNQQLRGQDS